jgi:protoporphyrin/coproporphyrin ferrochelatase
VTGSDRSSQARRVGVLVMFHGTPRSLGDLRDFYTEIRRGQPPSEELLSDLESRYLAIGGLSPLTQLTEAQVAGIAQALEVLQPGRFTVEAGAKFSAPRIEEAVARLADTHVTRVIGVVLAPHSSVVSVGEYARRAREAIASLPETDRTRPPIDLEVIDHWHMDPGLISLLAARVRAAGASLGVPLDTPSLQVLFSAHSVPAQVIDRGDTYPIQVAETASAVAEEAGISNWRVVWQSAGRSGGRWLGPDILEVIDAMPGTTTQAVIVCPIGFVSDHLEILYDLDVEASERAKKVGITFARTGSLNDDPLFCETVARIVVEADARLLDAPPDRAATAHAHADDAITDALRGSQTRGTTR